MSNPITRLANVKRKIAKLKPVRPYFDPFDAMMSLWNAFEAMVRKEGR